jgi:hypothetical protein
MNFQLFIGISLPPPEAEVMQSFDKCVYMKPCAHNNSKNIVCILKMFILVQATKPMNFGYDPC